jgi:hypothetical protein
MVGADETFLGCGMCLAGAAMQDIVTEPGGRAGDVAKRRALMGLVILGSPHDLFKIVR